MGDVIFFSGETRLPIPPEQVIGNTEAENLSMGAVLGWQNSGELYLAVSESEIGANLVPLEKAKQFLLDQVSS